MANHKSRIWLGSATLPTYGLSGQWKFVRGVDESANLDFNIGDDDVSGVNEPPVDGDELQLAIEDLSTIGAGNIATRTHANCIFLLDFNGATTGTVGLSFHYDIVINVNIYYTISGAITAASIKAEFDEQVNFVEVTEVEAGNKFLIEFRGDYEGLPIGTHPEWPATITNDGTDETVTMKQLTFSGYINSWSLEFIGALADTLITDAAAIDIDIVGYAGTMQLVVDQSGVEDIPIDVDISIFEAAVQEVTAVNEVQELDFAWVGMIPTTGTFTLYGNSTSADITLDGTTADVTAVQTACDSIWGSGNTSVTQVGDFVSAPCGVQIEFIGSKAATDIPEMTLLNTSTSGTVTISTDTEGVTGVTGVHQTDDFTLDGTPDNGSVTLSNGTVIPYDATNEDIESLWYTYSGGETVDVVGSPADGGFTVTYLDDYDDHTPPTVSTNTLVVQGLPTRYTLAKLDDPTTGTFTMTQSAGTYQGDDYEAFPTANIPFGADYDTVAAALDASNGGYFNWVGISGDGDPETPWVIETEENCDVEILAFGSALGRSCGVQMVTTQAGGGGGAVVIPKKRTLTLLTI